MPHRPHRPGHARGERREAGEAGPLFPPLPRPVDGILAVLSGFSMRALRTAGGRVASKDM
ncbi:unnamed protein product [Durusdinium trenchii]|uniref:Uncharacterized protein n=1 Tax=Durusdinium trenchii TaxID=1381693 RepID=A0ABP0KCC4_9DINO